MASAGVFVLFLVGACVVCGVPGVLLTLGLIRAHDRLWTRLELRRPWATAELAEAARLRRSAALRAGRRARG